MFSVSIDLCRSEMTFFDSLKELDIRLLPKQILIETHFISSKNEFWLPAMMKFYRSFLSLKYNIAFRELNLNHPCCAEYVLIRQD